MKAVKICAVAFFFTLFFAFIFGIPRVSYSYDSTTLVYVQSGDTLWKIARSYSMEGQDVRRVIDEIQTLNECGNVLYPGQVLQVPVYK